MRTPCAPRVVTRWPTLARISRSLQPVLDSMSPFSYSLENRYVGAVQQDPDLVAVHPGDLLREVGGERDAARAALLGVAEHRLGVVRADQHQVEAADPVRDRLELDEAGLAHRAGVEGADLVVVGVGGADEARGVQHLGDPHGVGVDAVALQPGAVVVEVGAGRADEDRPGAELAHAEAMFAPTPPRRTSRLSTRKERETVCSWSATNWSAKRPGKVIRWSVAMEPVTAIRTARTRSCEGRGLTVNATGSAPDP